MSRIDYVDDLQKLNVLLPIEVKILRLRLANVKKRDISLQLGISRTRVNKFCECIRIKTMGSLRKICVDPYLESTFKTDPTRRIPDIVPSVVDRKIARELFERI